MGSVGLGFQITGQFPQKRVYPDSTLYGLEADPITTGAASIGSDKPPGMIEDILLADLVVAPDGCCVMGSVGPTGEFLEPLGPVSESEMYEAFVQQIEALAEGGADGVVVETMTAIEEATLAIRAARENTDLLVMATMVFDKGPRGFFTMMGVTPERAARELREAGAHVVGTNCGNGIDNMVEVAKAMRQETDGYLLVHSNAGIPAMKGGQIIYPESPEYMAERFKQLADIGVDIIGGCCGTGPEHIRALVQALGR